MTTVTTNPVVSTAAAAAGTSAAGTSADITSGASSLSTSYSTFLTLLTTQLKNQDPTAPLDTNAFTQQLVSMTGVQQQLLSNQLLQQLVTASGSGQGVAGSVGLIGKTVTAASNSAALSGGSAAFGYTLPSNASSATLTVSDSTGAAVWTGSAPDLSKGTHAFDWNGVDQKGAHRSDGGTYTLSIAATDSSGAALTAAPVIQGVVTGVVDTLGVANVLIGSNSAPVSRITSVSGS